MPGRSLIEEDLVLPPENFSMIEPGVYRSAFPRGKNQSFLLRLGIKTIIPLVPEEYPVAMADFCARNNIKLVDICGTDGNKWPFKEIDEEVLKRALFYVMHTNDKQGYEYRPCLIHCNKGKHRTGSLAGCIRKLRNWSMSSIVTEYLSFANPKARLEDQRFIDTFDPLEFTSSMNKYHDEVLALEKMKVVAVTSIIPTKKVEKERDSDKPQIPGDEADKPSKLLSIKD